MERSLGVISAQSTPPIWVIEVICCICLFPYTQLINNVYYRTWNLSNSIRMTSFCQKQGIHYLVGILVWSINVKYIKTSTVVYWEILSIGTLLMPFRILPAPERTNEKQSNVYYDWIINAYENTIYLMNTIKRFALVAHRNPYNRS